MLTVLGQGEDIIWKDRNITTWRCQCSCENKTIIDLEERVLRKKDRVLPVNCGCLRHHDLVQTEDLTGKIFGMLTVLNREADSIDKNGNKTPMWKCKCSCNNKNEIIVSGYSLKEKRVISCGCVYKTGKVKPQKDLTGKNFGRWTVLR